MIVLTAGLFSSQDCKKCQCAIEDLLTPRFQNVRNRSLCHIVSLFLFSPGATLGCNPCFAVNKYLERKLTHDITSLPGPAAPKKNQLPARQLRHGWDDIAPGHRFFSHRWGKLNFNATYSCAFFLNDDIYIYLYLYLHLYLYLY